MNTVMKILHRDAAYQVGDNPTIFHGKTNFRSPECRNPCYSIWITHGIDQGGVYLP